MIRNTVACLESWADELLSKADRVRNLIGNAHWLSDGHYKEELVKEYFVRHLPNSLRVTRGFICSIDEATRVSPEIDILITDQESELPWFVEGGLTIAPPTAVCGQIHVKTEFGAKELMDVFESCYRVFESCEPHRDPTECWAGAIFFAHSDCSNDQDFSKRFKTTLEKYLKDSSDKRHLQYLPDCIAIVGGPVVILQKQHSSDHETKIESIRMFHCNRLSVAILLSHFYDSLTIRGRNLRKRGEWTQLLQQEQYRMILETNLWSHNNL